MNDNETENSSSFLDKLGIVGTIIKVVWFPIKIVWKTVNWIAKMLTGGLFN